MAQPTAPSPATRRSIRLIDARRRFIASCCIAILAFFALSTHPLSTRIVATWDAFALTALALAGAVIVTQDPYEVRRQAKVQDAGGTFIFTVVICAAAASLFAVILLLGATKHMARFDFAAHLALSIFTIALSWTLVHTIFGMHYARLYYVDAQKLERDEIDGGLLFPKDDHPDYIDFAYFSFVIGMTCQVSDVQVSSKPMRRIATIHGLISFAFNTAILAMFVNIVASLI